MAVRGSVAGCVHGAVRPCPVHFTRAGAASYPAGRGPPLSASDAAAKPKAGAEGQAATVAMHLTPKAAVKSTPKRAAVAPYSITHQTFQPGWPDVEVIKVK